MSLTKNGQDNHTRSDNEKKLKKKVELVSDRDWSHGLQISAFMV